jgi:hypothetical protein
VSARRSVGERGLGQPGTTAAILVAAVLLIDLWVSVRHPTLVDADTSHLVNGAQKVVDCLHGHVLTNCDSWAGGRKDAGGAVAHVGPWPLLQYVPAVALRAVGVSHDATLRVLIALNGLAIWSVFALVWITVRRLAAPVWGPLVVVTLLASPLLWYATAGVGEPLAAAIVVAAIAATLLRARPVIVGGLVALASTTKETNVVFVLALVVICVLAQTVRRPEAQALSRRLLVGAGVGAIAGVATNVAFNVFRFGSVRNTTYLEPFSRAPNGAVVARAFAAQWVAPNGGLLWFWPASLAVIGLTCAGAIWTLRRTGFSWRTVGPALVAGVFIVNVVGLSTWYSPFGWIAWGPRLTLSLLPAMLLVSCCLAGDRATHLLHRVMAGRLFWPAALLTILAGLPEAAVVFKPRAINEFFAPGSQCAGAHITQNPARYYRCFDFVAWQKRPFLLQRGLEGLGSTGGRVFVLTFVGAVIAVLRMARAYASRALSEGSTPPGPNPELMADRTS